MKTFYGKLENDVIDLRAMETASTLLELDTEVVSMCLSHLEAHSQGACMRVCKLFWLLLTEVQSEPTSSFLISTVIPSTQSDESDPGPLKSAVRRLSPQLAAPPTMGMLFTTPRVFATAAERKLETTDLVRALPPCMHLVGGQVDTLLGTQPDGTLAVFRGRGVGGCALTLGAFPEAVVSSFAVNSRADASERDQLEAQGALAAGWKVFVLMSCGDGSARLDEFLHTLQSLHPEAAIIGGIATGEWLLRAHEQRITIVRNGIVGLMFGGNVPLTALVCKGEPSERLAHARSDFEEQRKDLVGGVRPSMMAPPRPLAA